MTGLSRKPTGDSVPAESITFVHTSQPSYSLDSKRSIRSHATAWSRRRQREQKAHAAKLHSSHQKAAAPRTPSISLESSAQGIDPSEWRCWVGPWAAHGSHDDVDGLFPESNPAVNSASAGSLQYDGFRSTFTPPRIASLDKSDSVDSTDSDAPWFTDDFRPPSQQLAELPTPPRSPVPMTIDLNELDPFGTVPTIINKEMASLLKFYVTSVVPKICHSQITEHKYNSWTIPQALQNPVLLYAILCRTAMQLEGEDRLFTAVPGRRLMLGTKSPKDRRRDLMSNYVNFKMKAIHHLNEVLRNGRPENVTSSAILAIVFLLRTETLDGSVEEMRAHLSGLQQLHRMGVNLDDFPAVIIARFICTIYLCCAMTRTEPPFPARSLPADGVSEPTQEALDRCRDPVLNLMASSFYAGPSVNLLGSRLLELVAKRRSFLLSNEIWAGGGVQASPDDLEYFTATEQSVDYRLLCLPFEAEGSNLTPLQETVRLALFVVGYAVFIRHEPFAASTRALVTQLRESLLNTDLPEYWAPSCSLLLWVMFIGAFVSRSQPESPWFIMHLARGIHQLKIKSEQELENVLIRYFYTERLFGVHFAEIWDQAFMVSQSMGSMSHG